ncbi:flavin monoamine oxidase family protein [Siminovitchia sediminis]|uniref:Flavin monoamine oxidase family protein n=1 Tax=Siminovitchia sediminis TaxID=1274353 RepID=A0ABW4KFU5_9BACI
MELKHAKKTIQLHEKRERLRGMREIASREMFDVIIIGAGFAGLIAARELEMLGRRVLIIEARDRLGGRTWVDRRLGCDVELGGTYVHWYQPHVWNELSRYHLTVDEAPPAKKVFWITDGKLKSDTIEGFSAILQDSYEQIIKEAVSNVPNPFDVLRSEAVKKMDHLSITDFLLKFPLTQEQLDLISCSISIDFNGPLEKGAATQMFRWWAFSQGVRSAFIDTVGRYKIKQGTKALVNAIAEDVKAEIIFSSIVSLVKKENTHIVVQSEDGSKYDGKSVIVTVPLSTLEKIQFIPGLSENKQAFIKQKQVSEGVKVWARIKGELEPFMTYAPPGYPLQSIHFEKTVEGDTIVVGFGEDASVLSPDDRAAVEKAIQVWFPQATVMESTGHDWVHDEFSMETWPMLMPNQLTSYIEDMRLPEHGVFLAGTTYANGWAGFIDGAIESGMVTGRKVHQYLKKGTI